jgi:hypothetical protein
LSQQIATQYLHFGKIVSAAIQAKKKFRSLFNPQSIKDYFPEADLPGPAWTEARFERFRGRCAMKSEGAGVDY